MSGDLDLEQRYRRVLPGYYRDKWEEDMIAALGVSVAGKTWTAPQVANPFPGRQLQIALPSRNQALRLYRILVPPS